MITYVFNTDLWQNATTGRAQSESRKVRPHKTRLSTTVRSYGANLSPLSYSSFFLSKTRLPFPEKKWILHYPQRRGSYVIKKDSFRIFLNAILLSAYVTVSTKRAEMRRSNVQGCMDREYYIIILILLRNVQNTGDFMFCNKRQSHIMSEILYYSCM